MSFMEVEYCTWERQQTYGMFDYSEEKGIKQYPKIQIKKPGKIFRNISTYQLLYTDDTEAKVPPGHQAFLKVDIKHGHFVIINEEMPGQSQPLSAIVPSSSGLKLRQGDKIRMGKAKLQLLRLAWSQRTRGNHYQIFKQPTIADRQSIFAASFYSQKEKASLIQSNPSCRYCYNKTIDDQNPFMALCNCSGHTKYIHLNCLVLWVRQRSGIAADYPKEGVYCVNARAFTCQVCKSLYRVDRLLRQVFNVDKSQLEEFAAFMVETQNPLIYVVDLKKEEAVTIGRSLQNLMIINELSVSRKHCRLELDKSKKQLFLIDNKAKFGTTVEMKKAEILTNHQFQIGRTKLNITLKKKLSFFQKLGFCSPQEQLYNQHKQ